MSNLSLRFRYKGSGFRVQGLGHLIFDFVAWSMVSDKGSTVYS